MTPESRRLPFGTLVALGSVWGLSEAGLGLALETCARFISGSVMTGIAFFFISAAWARSKRFAGPALVTAIALAFKLLDAVWLGLPVQWCGLVYADALYRLEPHDPKGPWKQLADGIAASGVFTFDRNGDMSGFRARRYYDRKDGATLEEWVIRIEPEGHREFEGIRIPARFSVTWHLKNGDFTWYMMEIIDVRYNK